MSTTITCEFCDKDRKPHRHIAIGPEDTAAVCFLCWREAQRGRHYDRATGTYVDLRAMAAAQEAAEMARQTEWLRNHPDTTPADLENYQDIPF